MARNGRSALDGLAELPWPMGLALGITAYLVIRHGLPAWLADRGPLADAFAVQSGLLAALAWVVLGLCTLAALTSYVRARHRRRLLDTCTELERIAALGWRDFERLIGEAYRRRGYTVEDTGLGGADGGIDLILKHNDRRILVQCKQWRRRLVPVNVVREMYGLLAHHRAQAVHIATIGGFTRDAAAFARGKPIELIDGQALLARIRQAQGGNDVAPEPHRQIEPIPIPATLSVSEQPACSRCGAPMVQRRNKTSGARFLGCSAFPRCRGPR